MRASQILLLLAILSLPIQLGKFFWPSYSFVLGLPIDYFALTFYFSDLVLISYFAFFVFENFKNFKVILREHKPIVFSLVLLNLYLFASSILVLGFSYLSLWFNLKTLQLSLFFLFASWTLKNRRIFKLSLGVFGLSLVWQSVLIIWQFIFQRSLGLWIFGERSFDVATINIAHVNILGRQMLRSYGTFPHPNVAGAFLIIGLLILSSAISFNNKNNKRNNREIGKFKLYFFSSTLAFFGAVLTFSKGAILALVLAIIVLAGKTRYFWGILILFIILAVLALKFFLSLQIASFAERLVLSQAALDIGAQNPWFGVGSGHFIVELSKLNLFTVSEVRLLQPVHNVFLLILTENGAVGLLLFGSFLFLVFKEAVRKWQMALILALLVFLSVDHFFWTVNQGKFLFWLSLVYISASSKN